VAQNWGIKILQVSNSADPLKSSNGEKTIQKAGIVLLQLLAPEVGNHGLKNLQSLDFTKPETGYLQIASSKQLVCKINEKIHHWTSNWYRSEEDATKGYAWAGGKSSPLEILNIWLQTKLIFQRIHLSNTLLGAAGWYIPETKLNKNISKNTTTKKNQILLVPKIMWYLWRQSIGCQRKI